MTVQTEDIAGLHRKAGVSLVPPRGKDGPTAGPQRPIRHKGTVEAAYRKAATLLPDDPAGHGAAQPQGTVLFTLTLARSHLQIHWSRHQSHEAPRQDRPDLGLIPYGGAIAPAANRSVPPGWWLMPAVLMGAAIWGLVIWAIFHLVLG